MALADDVSAMTATVHLAESFRDDDSIDCEEVRVLGNVLWLIPEDEDGELVVPIRNALGIEGESVEQHVDELPSPGGQYTELVTDVS